MRAMIIELGGKIIYKKIRGKVTEQPFDNKVEEVDIHPEGKRMRPVIFCLTMRTIMTTSVILT